jgi:hypothetical protein
VIAVSRERGAGRAGLVCSAGRLGDPAGSGARIGLGAGCGTPVAGGLLVPAWRRAPGRPPYVSRRWHPASLLGAARDPACQQVVVQCCPWRRGEEVRPSRGCSTSPRPEERRRAPRR